MIRGMRVVNALLAILLTLFGIAGIIRALLEQTRDMAYRFGEVIGFLAILAPLLAAFYLTWRALGPDSYIGTVKQARKTNIIVIVLLGLLFLLGGIFSTSGAPIAYGLGVAVFLVPFVLNLSALGRKRTESEQASVMQRDEPLPETEVPARQEAGSRTMAPTPIPVPATPVAAPAAPKKPGSSGNYLMRHWRGELSLGVSYWINGGILAGIAPMAVIALLEPLTKQSDSLRAISAVILGVLAFSIIAWFWSIVGIWRSANHHAERGGKPGWATAAKVMVVIGIIGMASQLVTTIGPQVREFALIALGKDPIGQITVKVATNGQSVIVIGTLREGSAAQIQKILDAAPGATSLVLNSNGGRLLEAQQLARIVRQRHLDTYVEDQCVSACTYVFLAGKERAATPNARIGFHQPSFPGLDAVAENAATQEMLDVYRTAGLPEAFVQRIGKTPPENVWYPSRDELIAAHVITRVSLGGEVTMSGVWMHSKQELLLLVNSIPLYRAIEQRFPGTINEAVERGWAVKERGGSDAEIMNAMRNVIAEVYPKLLKTAEPAILEDYIQLLLDEMLAARAVSNEACVKLLASQLDITKTLPKELSEREQQLLMRALAAPPRTNVQLPDPTQVRQAIQSVAARMSPEYVRVLGDMKSYADQPELVCGATLAFYQGIEALSPPERVAALQGMFQLGER